MEGMTDEMMKDSTEKPRGFGDTPDPEESGEQQATESEQLNYDMLTTRGAKMIFGPAKDDVLKMLGSAESPAKGMGQAASMIIKSLLQSAKKGGREIESDVALEAGVDLLDDLNELGKASGVFQYEDEKEEESELADAGLWGVKYYGDGMVTGNEITPDMQKMAQQQVQEGIAEEDVPKPKTDPIAAGVNQAVQPQGMVAGQMAKPQGGY